MLREEWQNIRQAAEWQQLNAERAQQRADESRRGGGSEQQAVIGTTDSRGVCSSFPEATVPCTVKCLYFENKRKDQLNRENVRSKKTRAAAG